MCGAIGNCMDPDVVVEHLDAFPSERPALAIARRESLLLSDPVERPGRRFREHPPIEVVRFPSRFDPSQPFGHPRGVYETDHIRVEWQTMPDHRQPFYHRNTGTDEVSYQVDGVRTLMTDVGSVDLAEGDFVALPDGVAHDNYGRGDIHVLFYVPASLSTLLAPARTSAFAMPPFAGWQPQVINEQITEGLGGPGRDIAVMPVDEQLLLEQGRHASTPLQVLRPPDADGTTWLYRWPDVMLGRTFHAASLGREYVRHATADEVQYQASGRRTLVSQRGMVALEPGDFVRIPRGVAFTSIHDAPSAHLALVSARPLPPVAETTRRAERATPEALKRLRGR
jgi:uncharacterized cupin superfamily protein